MSREKAQPVRRRGAALEKALLDAAWQELNDVGYEQLTFENVARRAGTSKTVLYRRWSNRVELVHAVLRAHHPLLADFTPDTGSLRNDVIALLQHMADGIDEFRMGIQAGIFIDIMSNKDSQSYLYSEITKSNVAIMQRVIQQARNRGEEVVDPIPNRVLLLPLALIRSDLLLGGGKVPTQSAIEEIVDDIFIPLVTNTIS